MDLVKLKRIIGGIVFFIAAFTYFATVQPSVSFWDCGEFIASANLLQVPHPPGTPFFLILGRLFAMIPFAENIAFRVNTVSVLSSAFVVLFLYLIAVKLIENYKNKKHDSLFDAMGTYLSAAIGALSLGFADTFWFNAVEAEVYAMSTFFIALVTWLIMVWNEKADSDDNEKYLIMIAYVLGLSIGVHLMSALAMVPIVMIIMFKKYVTDEQALLKSSYYFVIHSAILLVVALIMWGAQTSTVAPSGDEFRAYDKSFVITMAVISAFFMIIFRKKVFSINSIYTPMMLGGVALVVLYPGYVKYVPKVIYMISGNSFTFNAIAFLILLGVVGFLIYWASKNGKETLNLIGKCFLFGLIGYSSYTMILIRSNQDTPINLNTPKDMKELLSYVNREQYGDFPIFKRRFTAEPHQQGVFQNYDSDLEFFAKYQMNHMFNRYLFWNYIGRGSTAQDSGVDWSKLLGIPFLVGLFGIFYHFKRDWKMASIYMIMFLFLGYLTAFYQNQQQPQPRERDYFYVGAFFVYSIWVAIGARGILDFIFKQFEKTGMVKVVYGFTLALLIAAIPVTMFARNYYEHDRSRNYMPWDYAYNLLQSVAPNAVIFTNGDNDTFPLWYLQDVEGVRQDVRIANLSLLNTPWYIKQLKNLEPHGAKKVKMNYSDMQISKIGVSQWRTKTIKLDVPQNVYNRFSVTDTAITNKKAMTWQMKPTSQYGQYQLIRTQDLIALDIVQANQWERPIYFAVTCSEDSRIGLDDYLRMEGLALRVTPVKSNQGVFAVDTKIMEQQLMQEPDYDDFSKDYQPGFKFRGLNDPHIFMDSNHKRLFQNYRNSFFHLAINYILDKENEKALTVLDKMDEKLPRDIVPMRFEVLVNYSNLFYNAGAMDQYRELADEIEAIAIRRLEANPKDFDTYQLLRMVYENLHEYNKLVEMFKRLQAFFPNDPTIQKMINDYQKMADQKSLEVKK